jgi:hypothetical protein
MNQEGVLRARGGAPPCLAYRDQGSFNLLNLWAVTLASSGSRRFNLKWVRRMVSQPFLVCMACLNVLLFFCRLALGDGENATQMNGILVGTVTKGPISPPYRT